jgi:hypothetical protein
VTPSAAHRSRWRVAALAVAVVVNLVILFWPRAPGGADVPGLDKVVHIATFGALAWTGLRAALPARWWLPLLALHAATSEVIQGVLLPHRSGDVLDVLADLVGVLAGSLIARASWRGDGSSPARDDADRAPARRDAGPG